MNTTDAPSVRLITSRGKGELFMNKRTRMITLLVVILALSLCAGCQRRPDTGMNGDVAKDGLPLVFPKEIRSTWNYWSALDAPNEWISVKENELHDSSGSRYLLVESFENTFIVRFNVDGKLAGEPLELCTDYSISGPSGDRTLVLTNSAWSREVTMTLQEQR
jgi:hypothetical protein